MAIITLVIEDKGDVGDVDIICTSEPAVEGDYLTTAQWLGLKVARFVNDVLEKEAEDVKGMVVQ